MLLYSLSHYIIYKVFEEMKISMFQAIAFNVVFFTCIIHIKPILQKLTLSKL